MNMKKSSFVAMIMGTIGGILAALGMCMCLQPEWNAFRPGAIMSCIGLVELLVTVIVWRRMTINDPNRMPGKILFSIALGIVGALLLGVGMCFAMMWGKMMFGIIIGLAGIISLLSIIPIIRGIK